MIARVADQRRIACFLSAFGINLVWINLSEVFRYFVFVMPMMRTAFPEMPDIAPMNLQVFVIWGLWDLILVSVVTGFVWIFLDWSGAGRGRAVLAGTLIWVAIFCIFWLGLWNMNLATAPILGVALPLSWLELAIAALIVHWRRKNLSAQDGCVA